MKRKKKRIHWKEGYSWKEGKVGLKVKGTLLYMTLSIHVTLLPLL